MAPCDNAAGLVLVNDRAVGNIDKLEAVPVANGQKTACWRKSRFPAGTLDDLRARQPLDQPVALLMNLNDPVGKRRPLRGSDTRLGFLQLARVIQNDGWRAETLHRHIDIRCLAWQLLPALT